MLKMQLFMAICTLLGCIGQGILSAKEIKDTCEEMKNEKKEAKNESETKEV